MSIWCLTSWNIWFFSDELMFRQWTTKNIYSFSLIDLIFCNRRKILMIHSSFSWTLRARRMINDLLQWISSLNYSRGISWRFSISLWTFCRKTYTRKQHFFLIQSYDRKNDAKEEYWMLFYRKHSWIHDIRLKERSWSRYSTYYASRDAFLRFSK